VPVPFFFAGRTGGINEAVIALRLVLQLGYVPQRSWPVFAPNPKRPFLETLLLSAVVVGSVALAAVVLYGATGWLWLVVREGMH
jgi:hypothetical protein